jgi:hypothetical protein
MLNTRFDGFQLRYLALFYMSVFSSSSTGNVVIKISAKRKCRRLGIVQSAVAVNSIRPHCFRRNGWIASDCAIGVLNKCTLQGMYYTTRRSATKLNWGDLSDREVHAQCMIEARRALMLQHWLKERGSQTAVGYLVWHL